MGEYDAGLLTCRPGMATSLIPGPCCNTVICCQPAFEACQSAALFNAGLGYITAQASAHAQVSLANELPSVSAAMPHMRA